MDLLLDPSECDHPEARRQAVTRGDGRPHIICLVCGVSEAARPLPLYKAVAQVERTIPPTAFTPPRTTVQVEFFDAEGKTPSERRLDAQRRAYKKLGKDPAAVAKRNRRWD